MIERLENIEKRYNEIMEEITKPEVLSDVKKTMELSKEQASLRENYEAYQEYKKVLENIKAAKGRCESTVLFLILSRRQVPGREPSKAL
jgi:peptide chain release factor 1